MIKTALISASVLMTLGIYVPLFRRVLRRQHTRDYSKMSQWFITVVQVNNLILAIAEKAPYLASWYVLQTILCATQLSLIYKFWNTLPPLLREKQ